jgi:predicted transposase/invertase (TIGR01784 family)
MIEANTLKKAEEKGREEGRKEEKFALAQKMLLKNMSLDEISEFTGLSQKEIEALK